MNDALSAGQSELQGPVGRISHLVTCGGKTLNVGFVCGASPRLVRAAQPVLLGAGAEVRLGDRARADRQGPDAGSPAACGSACSRLPDNSPSPAAGGFSASPVTGPGTATSPRPSTGSPHSRTPADQQSPRPNEQHQRPGTVEPGAHPTRQPGHRPALTYRPSQSGLPTSSTVRHARSRLGRPKHRAAPKTDHGSAGPSESSHGVTLGQPPARHPHRRTRTRPARRASLNIQESHGRIASAVACEPHEGVGAGSSNHVVLPAPERELPQASASRSRSSVPRPPSASRAAARQIGPAGLVSSTSHRRREPRTAC